MSIGRRGTALLCVGVALGLQGCVFTRVMETRAQFCDEPPPRVTVAREPGRGLRVLFEKPALTEQDVIWLIGLEPTRATGTKAVRELVYEARPVGRPADPATSLSLRPSFSPLDGEARLAEGEIPDKFNAILPAPLPDAAVKVSCNGQIATVPPRGTFDLADVDRSMLSGRDALQDLLGPPTAANSGNTEVDDHCCLAPCEASARFVAKLRFSFGAAGEVRQVQASYFRDAATVDLASPAPRGTIERRP